MQAVQVDSTLYISGQIGFIPSTMEVMGQTKEDIYIKDTARNGKFTNVLTEQKGNENKSK